MERLRAVLPRLGIPVDETLDMSRPCVLAAQKINWVCVQVQGSNSPLLLCPGEIPPVELPPALRTNSRRMWSCWWESRGGHRDGSKAGPPSTLETG